MNKDLLRKWLPYLIAIVIFILFTIIYCSPILEGKVVQSGDILSWKGMYQEAKVYNEKTGDDTFWSGSMFSGMPTYQTGGGKIQSETYLKPVSMVVSLGFKDTLKLLIWYLLGFFILLKAFKVNTWLSIVGAMAITLSSYFFIIIEAGHVNKAIAIAQMAPVIAGFFFIFNKNHIWGAVFTMIGCIMGITKHPQMAYYYFMLIGCLLIAELFIHIKEKRIKDFLIATLLFGAAVGIGLGTRYTTIKLNQEYAKETMRGGHSELVKDTDNQNKTKGLDLDYATQWSYGIDETMTLLIPNFMGASSNYDVGTNSIVYDELMKNGVSKKNSTDFCKNVPVYWGNQPFTSGPVYIGAIICFLFVLGLCIVKGPYKWALLVATLFSILLSWGKNFMPLTELFFNYFPMYNKFRTVSSILVVAEVTMPLLGFLAIKAIMEKQITKEKLIKNIYISSGITAGICLIIALFGGMFYDFTSPNDESVFAQLPEWLCNAIVAERASMLRTDAFRSFAFILLGAGTLWLFVKEKLKLPYFIGILGILILADMWTVSKRFFNDNNFVSPKSENSYFKKQPYEERILQDPDPHFRVLNLTTNTFNESRTSYYLKHIGGYHAAKLRRYQDLISEHISTKMNMSVINMLNTKYFIVPDANKNPVPQYNPLAMGNAWYIDSVLVVNTPNEECDALNEIDLKTTAVLDVKFADFVKDFVAGKDTTAQITFLSYAPNALEYQTHSDKDGIVVFSEIYYPYGWHAFIDGQPTGHFRVNYTLRALNVPAGEHHIRFEFKPDTLKKAEPVSILCIIIMYGTIVGGIAYGFVRNKKMKTIIAK
ncbi:MAG: YfhO family protein [Bacteroidetes bacterium]|nr:YfhO family protein [Bacteroidota bacterium]MCL1968098.1 YfhO family protein [Bacteroidota bacterium]